MFIDINEIERLHNENMSVENWNDILIDINQNINQIIKNEYADKYSKCKININIILNKKILNDPNAHIYKIDNDNYEIIIGKKLLILTYYYSHKIINHGLLFEKVERTKKNEKKLYKIAKIIFYFWIEFIYLHEWAHIVSGHLSFNDSKCTYYEFKSIENNKDSILFEIDADVLATKVLMLSFLNSFKILKKEIQENNITLIENFYMMMLYLFDLVFRINGKNIRDSHPSSVDRMISLLTIFTEMLIDKENLLKIPKEEIKKIGIQSIFKFTIKYLKDYKINKKELMKDFDDLTNAYFKW